ncbi:MAG: recombinase family protein [Candidatus Woesebacteria bacterium]|nr:recombinase family protein [Candidatus Woesebacteria bacterium]
MKGLIATRFSDQKQVGGTSTETQLDACEKYCKSNGIEVIGYHKVEAESAKSSNVSRIAELVGFCRKYQGKAKVLVVFKVDRFARDVSQHYYLKTELIKMGIGLRSATEPIDDTPQGELMETILAGFAQFDNSVKRERVKLAMWARVEQGLYPWDPPYGYKPIKVDGVKLSPRVIDSNCSETIKYIFTRFSTGLISKADLSRDLRKRKVKNYKRKFINFSIQNIFNILNNRFYCGLLKTLEGKVIIGKHEALIPVSLYEKCQEVQKDQTRNINTKRMYNNPDFPLRRFVSCTFCSKPLTACWAKSAYGNRHPYYYCRNPKCIKYAKMIKKVEIENQFMDYLKAVKPTEIFIRKFKSRFIKRYEKRKGEIKGDYLNQLGEIQGWEKEEKWIIDSGMKGVLPDHIVKTRVDEIEKKITLAKMGLTEKHEEELDINALLAYAENFIQTIEMNWFDAPLALKMRLQRAVFPNGVIYEYPGYSNAKISPVFEIINTLATSEDKNVTYYSLRANTLVMNFIRLIRNLQLVFNTVPQFNYI